MRSALVALVLLLASPVFAAAFAVDVTTDGTDSNPGNGTCADATGACTLRAAIQEANALAGPDQVNLPAGIYALTLKRDPASDAATGDLDVTTEITVAGAGNRSGCDGLGCTVIDAKKGKDRAFDVTAAGDLRLENLSVRNGKAAKDDDNDLPQIDEVSGGCVRVEGNFETDRVVMERCSSPDDGGCIGLNDGSTAALLETFLTACKAKDDGGAIETDEADLSAYWTTISSCKSGDDGGGIEATGGTVFLRNATLSGNKAKEGGGIAVEEGTLASIVNATFADNKAADGANLHNEDFVTQLQISNSIVFSKKGNDCGGDGFVNSLGYNLAGSSACGFTGTEDQQNEDPLLDALADNGGEVPTRALLAGSPAIDAGGMGCETTDARGFGRNGTCDVGAFEFEGVEP